MTESEKKDLKKQIKALIDKMKEDIIVLEKMTEPVKPENSLGRISRMDAINNKSVMEVSLRNKRDKLTKLRVALVNIDNENFGQCKMCKNPIQPKRLIYMPESNRCVRCADR